MKALIIYGSRHHGNTETLVKAIAQTLPVDLLDGDKTDSVDWEQYEVIGFASGLDFGKFYPTVTNLARSLPAGKKVFALFTCARDNGRYGEEIQEIARQRSCVYLGKFGCRGYNTYGPWKLLGGMNKDHPNGEEIREAVRFVKELTMDN